MNRNLKVIFCSNVNDNKEDDAIYVYPTKGRWNDFKYKIYGAFEVFINGDVVYKDDILMALRVASDFENDDYLGIGNVEEAGDLELFLQINKDDFFSLLIGIDRYRNIISELGRDFAMQVLSCLNDVVLMKTDAKKNNIYDNAVRSYVFVKSFLRNSERFFAFNNAQDILGGLEYENLSYISSELILRFKMDGFSNDHELKLKYSEDNLIPKRINIIIGENGVGKSQSLNHFVRSALQQRKYKDELLDAETGSRPMINRVLAIATPGETRHTFPNDNIINPKLYYKRLVLTRNASSKQSRALGNSIVQLARMNKSISNLDRWEIFITALEEALPLDKVVVPLKHRQGQDPYIHITELADSWHEKSSLEIWSRIEGNTEPKILGEKNLYSMSSGQLSFFKFALLSCLYIENGSFVLLDEPETHLHPSLISDFVRLLDNILEKTGSYSLIATHSPYLVREVARGQVHILKKTENSCISIQQPRLKTFGANVGDISYFVFDENYDNSLSEKIIRRAKDNNISYPSIKESYSNELPAEALHYIKEALTRK